MAAPLPQLGTGDFCRGGVFHQMIDRHTAVAGQPGSQILDGHADVAAHAGFGDAAGGTGDQICSADRHVLTQSMQLIGLACQLLIEDVHGQRDQPRMRHPGAIMTCLGLAQFVCTHFFQRLGIGLLVALDRNLRRHAAHSKGATAMAGLDQQLRVITQERYGHGDLFTFWKYFIRMIT